MTLFTPRSLFPFFFGRFSPPNLNIPNAREFDRSTIVENYDIFLTSYICDFNTAPAFQERIDTGRLVLNRTFRSDGVHLTMSAIDLTKPNSGHNWWQRQEMQKVEIGLKEIQNHDISSLKGKHCNYIGIDLGDTWTVGASSIGHNGSLTNFAVRKRYFHEPTDHYNHTISEWKKQNPHISALESSIVNKGAFGLNDFLGYVSSWGSVSSVLFNFYGQRKILRARWRIQVETRSLYDKAVANILRMVSESIAKRKEGITTIIAIGMGDFQSQSGGLPSLHAAFGGYLIAKVHWIIISLLPPFASISLYILILINYPPSFSSAHSVIL